MKHAILSTVAAVLLITSPASGQCALGGPGGPPIISVSSDLWDSTTEFSIENAAPGAPWLWVVDVTPGPQLTPFGPLCFGPSALFLADSFGGLYPPADANGRVSFSGTISSPGLIGFNLYMQALVVDFSAPFNLARSASYPFTVRSPRVYVTSGFSSIDVFDGYELATSATPTAVSSGSSVGAHDFALSRDGDRMFVRDNTTTPVRCYDVTTNPPTLLGTTSFAFSGPDRPGIAIAHDDATGWFLSSYSLHRFDADPASPTFMQVTGTVTLTVNGGMQSIVVSPDDQFLYLVGGDAPSAANPSVMVVVDTAAMAQFTTIPLTNASLLLGFAIREPLAMSPDGRWVATIQQGAYPFAGSAVNVVSTDPNSPAFLNEVAFVPLPNTNQTDVEFSLDGFTLFTVDRDAASAMFLTEIEWNSGSIIGHGLGLNTSDPSNFFGSLDFTPNRSLLYVTTGVDDHVRVFDSTITQIASHPLPSSGIGTRLAVEDR